LFEKGRLWSKWLTLVKNCEKLVKTDNNGQKVIKNGHGEIVEKLLTLVENCEKFVKTGRK
jgi:hypothetical protein